MHLRTDGNATRNLNRLSIVLVANFAAKYVCDVAYWRRRVGRIGIQPSADYRR